MAIFITILWNNVVPLSVMIAIGIMLQRVFSLDIRTLSKLNFYLFAPAVMFKLLYTTNIAGEMFGNVLLFFVLFMGLQYGLIELAIRLRGLPEERRGAMRNSVLFYNSANYGIPLNQLAFHANPVTLAVQVIIMTMQSLLPNTYGIYSVNARKSDWRSIARVIAVQPVIYVIPIAFLLHAYSVPIPGPIMTPIDHLADAFIGTALVTLGVQLGSMEWKLDSRMLGDVALSNALRLAGGPLLAGFVIWGLAELGAGMESLTAKALIVSSAVPTSLSSVLLAVEFDNEQEFASQAVFTSTVLSMFSVAIVIWTLGV
ncbi:AEC family transporter [Paenibacillus sp. MMS18-CY102]|uniref:AEC family transporter n=1 Tax=Paenibacillus sp. MMS18-CY102 TaxID=2682849 RepID=UPI001365C2B0|nr:AEC family transporter [Paenibacillus sp. MMS18-CY102]MWC29535.1 AEC family transporter [Paenibacillus sp. MMS18-CY102]